MTPTASQTIQLSQPGDVTNNGIVILSKMCSMAFDEEVSIGDIRTTYIATAEARIIRITFACQGNYEVQVNGHAIYGKGFVSRFETLEEAAEYLEM